MIPDKDNFALSTTPISGGPAVLPRKEMTVQDLWGILSRRRTVFVSAVLVCLCLAGVLFSLSTRLYKGTAEIQVHKESADALSMDSMIGPESQSDSVDSNITLQTQAQILQSESLALQVVRELHLENSKDFRSHFNPISWALGLAAPKGIADPPNVPLEEAPGRRAQVVKTFEAHLKVKPVSGTRLIDVEYLSTDPQTAAAVVNRLVQDLIEYNFETRHNATREASGWLGSQLAELRQKSEALQDKVIDLQRDSGVFSFGQTDDQGHEQVFTPELDRLQQATSQLEQAQSARIMKGALYQIVKNGDPELISGLAGNGMLSASSGVSGSLSLLQGLRSEEAQSQAKLNELSSKFGPGYPKLAELQSNLDSTRKSIREEAARTASRVKNDYMVSQEIEDKDRAVFQDEKDKAQALNNKAVDYQIAKQEAAQSRSLYETLVGRMKEADLVAGLRSSNITLVDPARVTSRPAKPNLKIYGAAAIAGGLLLGICGALFQDAMDNRIRDLGEMELLFAETSIGLLPFHDPKTEHKRSGGKPHWLAAGDSSPATRMALNATIAATEPRAAYTEALRVLCTSLMQGNHGSPLGQVILVTSSLPGEGKSMLSANLAIAYAQRGKKVLLVDADLRTPVLHQRLHLDTHPESHGGLSSLLAAKGTGSPSSATQNPLPGLPDLHVLPAGPLPDYPAELLASDGMATLVRTSRKEYDYVIIDGAPILPVTDSALLSRYADFILIVARHNATDRGSLERTCQTLRSQGARRLGLVLNGVKTSSSAQYRPYGYKQLYQGNRQGGNLHA